jgi:4-hydroxybenzoate polyprenyltransferase
VTGAADPTDTTDVDASPAVGRPSASSAFLRLIRLPNCFTAVPDALAGWVIAASLTGSGDPVVGVVAGVVGFVAYAGGVAMNDLTDVAHDRHERPERPIPSGAISGGVAAGIVTGFLAAGVALVAPHSVGALAAYGALVAAIVAYNLLHKRIPPIGLPLMGLSRALNLGVGFALGGAPLWDLPALGRPEWLLIPAVMWLYVLSISLVARLERRFDLAVKAVPRMILGIALLDAGFVLIAAGPAHWPMSLLVAVWIIPAALLKRRIAMS